MVSLMTNHEYPSESDHELPDQTDRPYSELNFFTQVFAEYFANGRLDPSTFSTEDLRVLESITMKMYADLKYLLEHGIPSPDFGLPPELLQRLEEEYNGTPPPETPQ